MPMDLKKTLQMRDRLYLLKKEGPFPVVPIYEKERFEFLKANEGLCLRAYKDLKGKKTIGIGFNMDRPEALREWDLVFQGLLSFHDYYRGALSLTLSEAYHLFTTTIHTRVQELESLYEEGWNSLKANEQLALEDAYFVGPALVGRKTQFFKEIQFYTHTGDRQFLKKAVYQLQECSNPGKRQGIQNRRIVEALMLNSPD